MWADRRAQWLHDQGPELTSAHERWEASRYLHGCCGEGRSGLASRGRTGTRELEIPPAGRDYAAAQDAEDARPGTVRAELRGLSQPCCSDGHGDRRQGSDSARIYSDLPPRAGSKDCSIPRRSPQRTISATRRIKRGTWPLRQGRRVQGALLPPSAKRSPSALSAEAHLSANCRGSKDAAKITAGAA